MGATKVLKFVMCVVVKIISASETNVGTSESQCVFEGHVSTSGNWFGYLANVTVMHSGRMMFEFTYAASLCCINVLFYTEEQLPYIASRKNCWQREYILQPENDQIIRLTPRFSWSGCHVIHATGQPMYSCEGGRSFAVGDGSSEFSNWFIAVSNCATRSGLELSYRLTIFGHMGQCRYQLNGPSDHLMPLSVSLETLRGQMDDDKWSADWGKISPQMSCTVEGSVSSKLAFSHLLANMSLHRGGGFQFHVQFPQQPVFTQFIYLVLYTSEDLRRLDNKLTCWRRYAMIRQRYLSERIIDLSAMSSWNGCASENTTSDGLTVVCRGERRFDEPRTFYIAAMNCRSLSGLQLKYQFNVYGHTSPETCFSSPTCCSSVFIFISALIVYSHVAAQAVIYTYIL